MTEGKNVIREGLLPHHGIIQFVPFFLRQGPVHLGNSRLGLRLIHKRLERFPSCCDQGSNSKNQKIETSKNEPENDDSN